MMQADHDSTVDIAICGAGPVGLALAALLVKRGMAAQRIVVIDAKTLAQTQQDPRSIALSYGSRQIMEQVGAWPIAATDIHQIHVSRRGQFGRTMIDREQHHVPALGYVTRYGAIVSALANACTQAGVRMMRPTQVASSSEHDDGVILQVNDQSGNQGDQGDQGGNAAPNLTLSAKIVVQAEGGIFGEQSNKALHRDYAQTALIAQIRVESPLRHRAYERFTDEGPLALLPQEDGSGRFDTYALVWCVKPETASALLALDDATFLAQLGSAFGSRLGRFISSTPRMVFPLGLNANPSKSARCVAIGNAAQTLHPVAGQGLNLGLRDATVLARFLAQEVGSASLQRFDQARQDDRALTVRLTDTMARIFTSDSEHSIAQGLLGASLGVIDAIDPAKHMLAELMMFGRR
jgi:2-octaprenyl-6-methoxyphenol hydroxylase